MTNKQKQDYLDNIINNNPIVKPSKRYTRKNVWSGESITMDGETTALVDYTIDLYATYLAFVRDNAPQKLTNDIGEMCDFLKHKVLERNPKAYSVLIDQNKSYKIINKK